MAHLLDSFATLPAETYVDDMVLAEGWAEFGKYVLEVEVEYRTQLLRGAFVTFGGSQISRILEFSVEELEQYFENQNVIEPRIATERLLPIAIKFLSGQLTNEQCKELIEFPD